MSKRSPDFLRRARDYYATPERPALFLLPYLTDVDGFCEPCCGDGALVRHLEAHGHLCTMALDLAPSGDALRYAEAGEALDITKDELGAFTHFITNPPWPAARRGYGEPTMSLIRHLSALRPTWMLLPADFMHNEYAAEVLAYCEKIVSVGRVKWIPDSKFVGKDNAAWYLFDQRRPLNKPPTFHARGGL